jgi:LacI family transcriptional regulator
MPRSRCPKCNKTERVLKSGIIRGKQRFYCKDCNYHFTLVHNTRKSKTVPGDHDRPTSLKDIAKAAGVSITTVSRALNDHPDISKETRQEIRQLADGMNYQPNVIAKSLVNRTTNTLGVIIPNLDTTFFSSMLSGIQHVAANSGYRVVICQSDESFLSEISNLQALMNNMIDGLLICHTLETSTFDHVRMQMNRNIPIVQFYRVSEELDISRIFADDENGATEVTEHLVRAGCKRIAILLGPKYLPITVMREAGYRKVLRKWKIKFDPKLVKYVNFSNESVVDAVDSWLSMKEGIDAIFSISDKSAVQIIRHLKSRGIKIPQAVNVVGFGNEYTGEIVEPKLTTFDVKTKEIGEAAARTLLEQIIFKDKLPRTILIKGEFIQRESTRKLRGRN